MMLRALLLCALLAAPGLAAARWYQVEVVVFRHNVESAAGGEQWPAMTELPDFSDSMDLITDLPAMGDEPGDTQTPQGAGPIAFKALERNERGLNDAERRLRNSREYAPLLSAAWRQPSFGVAGAKRVHLSDVDTRGSTLTRQGGEGDSTAAVALTPRIEGTVMVKVARQMSVDIDFIYDHDGTPVRLKASRGMKLRELHYFDHPLFGVLVQVVPFDLPEEDPAAGAGSDEPLDEGAGQDDGGAVTEPD
ncbi:MAG: hypothetical protein IPG43_11390 [Proteobacteria bacterium]|nr:hypothetical protein [Pseudomonadota bacterium]